VQTGDAFLDVLCDHQRALAPDRQIRADYAGWGIVSCGQALQFTRPDGPAVPDVPKSDRMSSDNGQRALRDVHEGAGLEIDAGTAVPRWDGRTPDYAWLVGALCASTLSGERTSTPH
jgi:hypothetical protein